MPKQSMSSNRLYSRSCAVIALAVILLAGALPFRAGASDSTEALSALLAQMESSYSQVNDFVAVFHKQERIKGKLQEEETIQMKFQKPLKVYMRWIGEPLKGTEALYVEGRNDNKLIARRGGILGIATLSLDPRGSLAMAGNRHPITESGFGFLLARFRENLDAALRRGELQDVRLYDETFEGRPSMAAEGRFVPRTGYKYYASRFVIHVDKELMLPTGAMFYNEKDELFEKYIYTNVQLNVGLSPQDFSRDNKAYRFN